MGQGYYIAEAPSQKLMQGHLNDTGYILGEVGGWLFSNGAGVLPVKFPYLFLVRSNCHPMAPCGRCGKGVCGGCGEIFQWDYPDEGATEDGPPICMACVSMDQRHNVLAWVNSCLDEENARARRFRWLHGLKEFFGLQSRGGP